MKEDRIRLFHYQKTLEKLQKIDNMVNEPFYDLKNESKWSINIRVSKDVPSGMFKPDPLNKGGWIANELTFRAMKKDLFALDENFEDLQELYSCESCHTELDKQFWLFCPYCGANFK